MRKGWVRALTATAATVGAVGAATLLAAPPAMAASPAVVVAVTGSTVRFYTYGERLVIEDTAWDGYSAKAAVTNLNLGYSG